MYQQEVMSPITIFCSYAPKDESLLNELNTHFSTLKKEKIIEAWDYSQILAGDDRVYSINEKLKRANIILLLVSSDFLSSFYSDSFEITEALEREKKKEVRVIPIILRPCDWDNASFAHLQCLPQNGLPVTLWDNQDEAFKEIAKELRNIISKLKGQHEQSADSINDQTYLHKKHKVEYKTNNSKELYQQQLLKNVDHIWIEGVLKKSLYNAAFIALELQERPDAISNPWKYNPLRYHPLKFKFEKQPSPPYPLPSGISILQVYDDANGKLLILGEPGSGKTTLLLSLTHDLLLRAREDPSAPVPVVLKLSAWLEQKKSWTSKNTEKASFADWIVQELHERYQIPTKIGQDWIDTHQLILLLDGLDEVVGGKIANCIQAINTFRKEHSLISTIVCSRSTNYLTQETRVSFGSAVMIQPLTLQQIDNYMVSAGQKLDALRLALHSNSILQKLGSTPLMLTILMLAYHDTRIEDLPLIDNPSLQRDYVFASYVTRMLNENPKPPYSTEQVILWLSYIAKWQKSVPYLVEASGVKFSDHLLENREEIQLKFFSNQTLNRALIYGGAGFFFTMFFSPEFAPLVAVGGAGIGVVEGIMGLNRKLWRAGCKPKDYKPFINYVIECHLFYQTGKDSYTFVHNLLSDYFAQLEVDNNK